MDKPILELQDARLYFSVRRGLFKDKAQVRAVDGVSFAVASGETFGLVGESGCGKTTLGKCVLKLHELTAGRILFEGQDISAMTASQFLPFRSALSMIFQDPSASLNPRLRVRDLIAEPLRFQKTGLSRNEIDAAVDRVMDDVRLSRSYRSRYPHEFSGGQQQRIGIARALVLRPRFIVCDEPVSALDVSVQAQIINLLNSLQQRYGLAYLFISHDLSVVKFISRRVAIMYLGRVVEIGSAEDIFIAPAHPYTVSLLASAPKPDPHARAEQSIPRGEVPSPFRVPRGCRFHPRCPYATDVCVSIEPALQEIAAGHTVACHNYQQVYNPPAGPAGRRRRSHGGPA